MSELYDILVETPPAKVILLALDQGLWDCERSLAELSALCEANHMEAVAEVTQKRQTPETGIVLGSGKLEEAAAAALLDAEAAGKVVVKDVIADAFLQNSLLVPEEYSVIATLNLNGDYVSDQLAAMVGGIGIAPGANINYDSGYAIFEATHGTAPNIAGKNVVNPCSLLLSSVMMLEYMGWNEAGRLITAALEHAFSEGKATRDLARFMPNGQPLGTKEFGEYIMSVL